MIDYLISEIFDIYILWTVCICLFLVLIQKLNKDFQNSILLLNTVYYSFIPLFIIKYLSSIYSKEMTIFTYSLIDPVETVVFSNLAHEDSIIDLYTLILSCYLIFVTAQVVLFLKKIVTLNYLRRSANFDDFLADRVEYLRGELGLRKKVNVYLSHRPMSAYSFGIFKHTIVFPKSLKEMLSSSDVDLILKHELIHIKNNDYLKHVLQTITKIIFSFNPLVLWLDKALSVAREVRCDSEVLSGNVSNKKYSSLLYYLATEWQRQLPETTVIAFYKPSHQLNRRIYMINLSSKSSKLKRNSRIASVLVLVTVFILACSNAIENQNTHQNIIKEIDEIERFPSSKETDYKIYSFKEVSSKPEMLNRPKVTYPTSAQKAGIEGLVLVTVIIDESGFPIKVGAFKGDPQLRDAAVRAARNYRFKPAVNNGKPVKVKWHIPFRFKLNKGDKE